MMEKHEKFFIAGHQGMVGSAIVRCLLKNGYHNLLTRTRAELDLTCQSAVSEFFQQETPEYVFMAAAKVGGIHANNTYPADFIYNNLIIQNNILNSAFLSSVKRLLFLGSSCIYPRNASQPIVEEELLTGYLEPTNEPYAIAKIAGIKMCESYNRQYNCDFRSLMPTNLYGPGDNFHPQHSHVVPALLRRFHEAVQNGTEEVVIWGTGKVKREFLHVDDMAFACLHVMNLNKTVYYSCSKPMMSHINVGTGEDCSISELVEIVADVTGYEGCFKYDDSKPDGTPRKLLNVDRLKSLGWESSIKLKEGLTDTYRWYLDNFGRHRQM